MQATNTISRRNHQEAMRLISLHKYEHTDDGGILIPTMGLKMAGHFETSISGAPWEIDPNLVVTEGRTHMLNVVFNQASANAAFYIGIFAGAVTPQAGWTAANVTANSTELTTQYSEANRVLWQKTPAVNGVINNDSTPAVFTATGDVTVRGAFLVSAQAKSAITGVLAAASRFANDKVLSLAEELRIKYSISLIDA